MRLVLLFVLVFLTQSMSSLAFQNPFKESFENDFSIESIPSRFLPNWYGNEVRSTSSRIFQSSSLGIGESKCLAIQPISTFDGEVMVRLNPSDYQNPKFQFWARAMKNGSGTRAAQVFISWGENLVGNFENRVQVGRENDLLANQGLYTWSGTDPNGVLVRAGYYVLLVGLFNLEGEKIAIRKTIVVAQRL